MDFCPNCGSRMLPKATSKAPGMLMLACKKCGYKDKQKNNNGKLAIKTLNHSPKQMVAVIDKEKQLNVEPTIQTKCPRCSNNTVFVWLVQTRGSDESSTQFMRCTDCGFTFREYS